MPLLKSKNSNKFIRLQSWLICHMSRWISNAEQKKQELRRSFRVLLLCNGCRICCLSTGHTSTWPPATPTARICGQAQESPHLLFPQAREHPPADCRHSCSRLYRGAEQRLLRKHRQRLRGHGNKKEFPPAWSHSFRQKRPCLLARRQRRHLRLK